MKIQKVLIELEKLNGIYTVKYRFRDIYVCARACFQVIHVLSSLKNLSVNSNKKT